MNQIKPVGKTIANIKGRCFVVGDLHGMYDCAKNLLDQFKLTPDDVVIFVGDLVDRGLQNDLCVDLAMQHHSIMGNHEDRHIQYQRQAKKGLSLNNINPSHFETRKQLTDTHHEFFESLPHFIRLPQFNAIVVHAGVYPGVAIEEQNVHHLLHIQMINPPERASKWPSKAPPDWRFWTNYWDGKERVIFGHSVLDKPLIEQHVVGIDGGAVFGCSLWGYELSSNTLYSTDANPGEKNNKRISKYNVHGNVNAFS